MPAQSVPPDVTLPGGLDALIVAGVVAASLVALAAAARLIWRVLIPAWHRLIIIHKLIERELQANSGKSMRDEVSAIRRQVDRIQDRHDRLDEQRGDPPGS